MSSIIFSITDSLSFTILFDCLTKLVDAPLRVPLNVPPAKPPTAALSIKSFKISWDLISLSDTRVGDTFWTIDWVPSVIPSPKAPLPAPYDRDWETN